MGLWRCRCLHLRQLKTWQVQFPAPLKKAINTALCYLTYINATSAAPHHPPQRIGGHLEQQSYRTWTSTGKVIELQTEERFTFSPTEPGFPIPPGGP